jgi:hypothetical protein
MKIFSGCPSFSGSLKKISNNWINFIFKVI